MLAVLTNFELFFLFVGIYYIHAYTNGISNVILRKGSLFRNHDHDAQMERVKKVICKEDKYCFIATISNRENIEGYPFGSILGYALNDNGIPIMALDEDSHDNTHLRDNNSVSLVIPNLNTNERIVYTGDVREVKQDFYDPSDELLNYKALFMDAHPNALWLEFPSVRFYILEHIKNIMYYNTYDESNVHLTKYMRHFP